MNDEEKPVMSHADKMAVFCSALAGSAKQAYDAYDPKRMASMLVYAARQVVEEVEKSLQEKPL